MSHPNLAEVEEFHEEFSSLLSDMGKQPAIFRFGLNTYHFGLNHFGEEDIATKLFLPHKIAGLTSAELAEDLFEDESLTGDFYRGIPTVNFGSNPPDRIRRKIDAVLEAADRSKVVVDSMGTGAFLYTRIMKGDGDSPLGKMGFYDLSEDEQQKRMAVMQNWMNIAHLVGAAQKHPIIIGGHRIATTDPAKYNKIGRLEEFAQELGWKNLDGLNPETLVSRGEALNTQLFIELQKYGKEIGVSNTTELLYQNNGIAPITIDQMVRMAKLLEVNGGQKVYMHMDIGHVIVTAKGEKTKQKKDYDLSEYAKIKWPRWVDHFNNLAFNRHGFPTKRGRMDDREISVGASSIVCPESYDCPYSELHTRDIYRDWLKENMWNCRVHQLTPEPKDVADLQRLGEQGREVGEILAKELSDTHVTHPAFNGYYVPKAMIHTFSSRFR